MTNSTVLTARLSYTADILAATATMTEARENADALPARNKGEKDAKARATSAAQDAAASLKEMRAKYPEAAHAADIHAQIMQAQAAAERADAKRAEVRQQVSQLETELADLNKDMEQKAATLKAEADALKGTLAQMRADRETRDAELKDASEQAHTAQQAKHDAAKSAHSAAAALAKSKRDELTRAQKHDAAEADEHSDRAHAEVKRLSEEAKGANMRAEAEHAEINRAAFAVQMLKDMRPNLSANAQEFAARYAAALSVSSDQDRANRALGGALNASVHELLWVAMQLNPAQRQIIADFAVGVARDGDTRAADPEQMTEQPRKEMVNGKERARAAFGRSTDGKHTALKRDQWTPEADAVRVGLKLTTRYRVPGERKLFSKVSTRGQYEQARELIKREQEHAAALDMLSAPTTDTPTTDTPALTEAPATEAAPALATA